QAGRLRVASPPGPARHDRRGRARGGGPLPHRGRPGRAPLRPDRPRPRSQLEGPDAGAEGAAEGVARTGAPGARRARLHDGPAVRRLGGATRHGALLDNAADVLFVLGAASTGATLGLLQSRVPVAIAVSFGAYALASAAGRAEAARAYTRIGHAAGVCNYLLAGLLAAVVARPGPGWGPVLDAAGLVVLGVNGTAAAVQAAGAVRR